MKKFMCLSVVGCAAAANAGTVNRIDLLMFEDNGVDPAIVDLWVDVVDAGSNVDFIFHNDSTDGSVANIYFENNLFLSNGSINGVTGTVAFAEGGSPGTPPGTIGAWGGNMFSASADNPAPTNGINPGETLTIRFDLAGSFGDLFNALEDPSGDNGFRIAQHAISFGSQSIWTTNVTVPAPGALAVLGFGGLAIRRRR